jgi:hypothetical protein
MVLWEVVFGAYFDADSWRQNDRPPRVRKDSAENDEMFGLLPPRDIRNDKYKYATHELGLRVHQTLEQIPSLSFSGKGTHRRWKTPLFKATATADTPASPSRFHPAPSRSSLPSAAAPRADMQPASSPLLSQRSQSTKTTWTWMSRICRSTILPASGAATSAHAAAQM